MQDNVEVPEVPSVMLGTLKEQDRLPADREVRVTFPRNPFWLITVTVEVPGEPARTATLFGESVTLKLETLIRMVTKWESPGMMLDKPVTVML